MKGEMRRCKAQWTTVSVQDLRLRKQIMSNEK